MGIIIIYRQITDMDYYVFIINMKTNIKSNMVI